MPSFTHILTEVYKQTLKGSRALQGKSESQIRSQVRKDLRHVAHKMIGGIMRVMYKENEEKEAALGTAEGTFEAISGAAEPF